LPSEKCPGPRAEQAPGRRDEEANVTIPLECDCGQKLRVKDEHGGRKVRCPKCQGVLEVPIPITPLEDDPPVMEMVTDTPSATPKRPLPPPLPDEDDGEETERQRKRRILPGSVTLDKAKSRRRRGDDDDDFDPPPIAKPQESWFGNTNAGVLGGMAMFVGGLVVFFGLLAVGFIWPYSLIVSVLGLITVGKGLISRE
jgi:hypothetical protein